MLQVAKACSPSLELAQAAGAGMTWRRILRLAVDSARGLVAVSEESLRVRSAVSKLPAHPLRAPAVDPPALLQVPCRASPPPLAAESARDSNESRRQSKSPQPLRWSRFPMPTTATTRPGRVTSWPGSPAPAALARAILDPTADPSAPALPAWR